jgi:hypothetical protein
MLFAGVEPDEARAATREEESHPEPEVRPPASARRGWLAGLGRGVQRLLHRGE